MRGAGEGRRASLLVALAAGLAAGPGCDRAWQGYQKAALGQPMPGDLVAGGRQSRLGAGYSRFTQGLCPNLLSLTSLRVLKDDHGTVAAKSYFQVASTHWGLFILISHKYVLEAEVPEDCFLAPAEDWEVPEGYQVLAALKIVTSLIAGLAGSEATTAPASGAVSRRPAGALDLENMSFSEAGRLFRSGCLPLADLPAGMREELWRGAFGERGESEAGRERAAATSSAPGGAAPGPQALTQPAEGENLTPIPAPRNVPEYLLFVDEILSVVPSNPVRKEREEIPVGPLSWMIDAACLQELLESPLAFRGVTRPGFSWRHRTKQGRTYIVRHLADRRMRVEMKVSVIRDPLLPLLGVNY